MFYIILMSIYLCVPMLFWDFSIHFYWSICFSVFCRFILLFPLVNERFLFLRRLKRFYFWAIIAQKRECFVFSVALLFYCLIFSSYLGPTLLYPTHPFYMIVFTLPSSSVAILLAVFTLFIWLPLFLFFFIGNAVVAIHIFYMIAFSPSFLPFYSRIPSPPLINIYSFLVFFISPLNFFCHSLRRRAVIFFVYSLLLQTCNLFDWKLGNYCPNVVLWKLIYNIT